MTSCPGSPSRRWSWAGGERDPRPPRTLGRLGHPRCRLRILDERGSHFAFWENPAAFNREIRAFLDSPGDESPSGGGTEATGIGRGRSGVRTRGRPRTPGAARRSHTYTGITITGVVRPPLSPSERRRGERFGAMLRTARGARSMVDVASAAGVSAETLRKIETGRAPTPAFFTVAALARALDLSLDDLAAACAGHGDRDDQAVPA